MDIEYLNELKAMYEKEKPPFFAWLAYDYARQLIRKNYDLTIPEWVYAYFDDGAKALFSLGPGKDTASRIASAIKMYTFGKGNVFTRAQKMWVRFYAIKIVLSEKLLNPEKKDLDIFSDVADGLSDSDTQVEIATIQNWYYDLRKKCEP
jgi:hypothetical protein